MSDDREHYANEYDRRREEAKGMPRNRAHDRRRTADRNRWDAELRANMLDRQAAPTFPIPNEDVRPMHPAGERNWTDPVDHGEPDFEAIMERRSERHRPDWA